MYIDNRGSRGGSLKQQVLKPMQMQKGFYFTAAKS